MYLFFYKSEQYACLPNIVAMQGNTSNPVTRTDLALLAQPAREEKALWEAHTDWFRGHVAGLTSSSHTSPQVLNSLHFYTVS